MGGERENLGLAADIQHVWICGSPEEVHTSVMTDFKVNSLKMSDN